MSEDERNNLINNIRTYELADLNYEGDRQYTWVEPGQKIAFGTQLLKDDGDPKEQYIFNTAAAAAAAAAAAPSGDAVAEPAVDPGS